MRLAVTLRRALTLAALAAAPLCAQAPGGIDGKIVDQSGRGIAGAQASLAPIGRHAVSDDDGTLMFVDLPRGTYTLSVRRIGYQPASVSVTVKDSVASVTLVLVAIPRQLDSVRIRERASGLRYSAIVLDQDDRPVPGAEVIAMGIESDVVTDSAGHFSIGKLGKAALVVRARKIGYAPALRSMRLLADRIDTLRMTRLATTLTPVEIREASGYGMDFWAYRDMQSRMAWKSSMGGAISREELDARGKQDLCDALPGTPSGARYSLHNDPTCKRFPDGMKNILVDGAMCRKGLLSDYDADEVEMVEFMPSDMSGSLGARNCGPPAYVIWLRKDQAPGAPPSFETLWKRACRASRPVLPTEGFVYGVVQLGSAATRVADEEVRLTWLATTDSGATRLVGRKSVTGAGGNYAICGVPLGVTVSIEAGLGDTATTPVAFRVGDARVARRDITIPTSATFTRLDGDSARVVPLDATLGATFAGRLVDSTGSPLPSARITVSGVLGQWGVAPDGTFDVRGIPAGPHVVSITAVGFLQERRFVEVGVADSVRLDLPMRRLGTSLETVQVLAERARQAAYVEELDRRHRAGFGFWVDSAKLANAVSVQQTMNFPRVNVTTVGGQWTISMVSGALSLPQAGRGITQSCSPTYWLDGDITDADRLNDVPKDEIGLIEVYPTAARAPAQYAGSRTNCGVVLFWTKRYMNP